MKTVCALILAATLAAVGGASAAEPTAYSAAPVQLAPAGEAPPVMRLAQRKNEAQCRQINAQCRSRCPTGNRQQRDRCYTQCGEQLETCLGY